MRKVLFVVDAYGSTMSANGVCVREIAKIFLQQDYEVHFLVQADYKESEKEILDGFHIHRIKSNFYNKVRLYSMRHSNNLKGKISYLLQKLMGVRAILLLPWYPMRAPFQCITFTKKAEELQTHVGFDLAICCFSPLSALYAGEQLKRKYNVPSVSYFVDTLTDNLPHYHFLPKRFLDKQGYKYEKRFFKTSDLILNLLCHEENFKQDKYDVFKRKMKIIDIPHLKNRISDSRWSEGNIINLVYTGSIRKSLLIPILNILSLTDGVKLHFYSSNTLIVPDLDFVEKHGQVNHDRALAAQESADVLVSMGNPSSAFIPSKIFEYISTGKPIMHFYIDDNDSCLYYYRKYENCLLINVNDKIEKNTVKIKEFLTKPLDTISWAKLEADFPMNKAEYTCHMIINYIKEELK